MPRVFAKHVLVDDIIHRYNKRIADANIVHVGCITMRFLKIDARIVLSVNIKDILGNNLV